MYIAVGTENQAKIQAVRHGFDAAGHGPAEIVGIKVSSGVPDQPFGMVETYTGAINRAERALARDEKADIGVGLEGGLLEGASTFFNVGIVHIIGRNGLTGVGMSRGHILPPAVAERIRTGEELSDAVAAIYQTNTIEDRDCSGVITEGYLTVTKQYAEAIELALHNYLQNVKSSEEIRR